MKNFKSVRVILAFAVVMFAMIFSAAFKASAAQMGGSIQGTPLNLNNTNAAVTTFAGAALVSGSTDATGTAARFKYPAGITTDGTNLYVADQNNHTIRQIVISTGVVTTIAGTAGSWGTTDGTGAAARFNTPSGITTDGANLYVVDQSNHTVRRIVISTGVVTTIAGTAGAAGSTDGTGPAARFKNPADITTDGTNLYVADCYNHTIRQIVISTGVVTTIAGTALTPGSTDGTGAAAKFNYPFGITTDGTNLYVADSYNYTIRKIVIGTGVVTTTAGTAGAAASTDGTGTAARFYQPMGITTDGTNLYVADYGNNTIRQIVISTGVVTTIAGTAGPAGSTDSIGAAARFNSPYGITTDGTSLYVADALAHTIRKIVGVVTYTVTYALGGGTGTLPTQANVATGGTFTVAAGTGLSKTGYTFNGWNDGTTNYAAGVSYTMGASNVTLTAQWTATSQTVTYALGGGTGTLPTQANVATGGTFAVAAGTGLTRSGYTFNGWNDGTTTYAAGASYTMGASNVTLTAQWAATSQTVTYALGGGTGTLPTQANVSTGGTFTVAAGTGLTRSGYTFNGWNDGTTTYAAGATYTMGAANVTLTAQWAATSQTVTYALGGGAGTLPTQANVATGGTFTVAAGTGLTKTGYTFNGWNDGTTNYAAGATYTMGVANVTLTAQWTINTYTVTTTATNGTITSTNNPTVNYNATTTVTGSATAGYYFTGVSGCSGTTQSNADQTITTFSYTTGAITSACTVTATFAIKTYTVTTTATNGTITSTNNPTVNYGSTTTVTGSATAGYYFTGVSGCSGTTQSNTDQTITTFSYTTGAITSNCTVTATFAIKTYTLTYTAGANGTLTGTSPQTVNYGANGTAVTAVPATGYHFVNWSDASTANPRTDTAVTANVTVTATFTLNTYTVTPSAGANGTINPSTPQTVNHGSTTTFTVTPNTGYTASVGGTCGGTLSGTTYTTNAITSNCTVTTTFTINNSQILSAASGGGNITITTDTAGCGFYEVEVKTKSQVADDPSYNYPYGLVQFKLNCAAADVRITFSNATGLSGTAYRKYGPTTPGDASTTQWYNFNNVIIIGNTIILHLQDGQFGDDTGVDGVIVDAGGPSTTTQETTSYSVPTMSEWGMLIFMLLAGLSSIYYMRRGRA